jgi:ubiquinone/menaquinone biosynthesis C-methylase UbiE
MDTIKTDVGRVAAMYDAGAEYEHGRLFGTPVHRLEYELTVDLLRKHIPDGCRALDLGTGTGVYAEFLTREKGCRVGLIDISARELALLRRERPELASRADFIEVGSALDLDHLADASFDAVLLFGPLYHLVDREERSSALRAAHRLLRDGGLAFCAYISPHRVYRDLVSDGLERLYDDDFLRDLSRGITYHVCEGARAEQFRCWPAEAKLELTEAGFSIEEARALEGVFSHMPRERYGACSSPHAMARLVEIAKATCEREDILGATLHFLVMGRKR